MTMVKCSECGELYKSAGVEVLGHTDEIWFVSLTCYTCFSKCLVAALMRVADTAPETAPSAPRSETSGSRVLSPVADTDVREMSRFLADFNGDFRGLFGRGGGAA
jgi:hypothetical protein